MVLNITYLEFFVFISEEFLCKMSEMAIILGFTFFFSIFSGYAQESSNGFVDGVKAYEAKNFEKAHELFSSLLEEHPNNPVILYNSGLAEYQLGHFGKALGLWRKARSLDHSAGEIAAAIHFTEDMLFPDRNDPSLLPTLYRTLTGVSLHVWLFLFILII